MAAQKSRSKFSFETFQNSEDKIFAVSKHRYSEAEADKLYRRHFKSRAFTKVPGYVKYEYFTYDNGTKEATYVVHYQTKDLPSKGGVPCYIYIYK